MNTTIFLIRHGQIDNPKNVIYGGNLELKLTEEGGKQIEEIARKIKKMGFNITKIYSSPMKRTISSSKIIEKVFGLKTGIILEKDLKDVNIPAL
ncbi:histidine phosphatase family protein, partial [Patescibacteria group bacterium]|nr:histidine phosphatase family protein [Patescibacteria group bacterium]